MISSCLQERLEALSDIERQHLLIHPPDGMGSMVDSAMTWINDDRVKIGKIGPRLEKGASGQHQHRQYWEQAESQGAE